MTKTPSNAQIAVSTLREMIFRGDLAPGSDHLESELAERLGMSRTPVREAALMLAGQGLLQLRPRKGVRIATISATDMRDIYDVLTELESLAAYDAARAGYGISDLDGMMRAMEDMESALATPDLERWAKADEAFHAELMRLGGNARAQTIVAMMVDQVRRARTLTLHMRPLPKQSNRDHRSVLTAIAAGDAEAARLGHRAHRQAARDMLLELIEKYQLSSL